MNRGLSILLTAGLVAIVGCSDNSNGNKSPAVSAGTGTHSPAKQSDKDRGPATLQCWNSANAIMDDEGAIRRTSKNPAQVAAALRASAKKFRQIPVVNIDPEFAFLCAEVSGWYDDLAGTFEKSDLFFRQYKQAQDHFNSPDAAAEAFLRGLLGDPLGKYNEAVAADNYLRQQFQALQSEAESKMSRCNELNTKAATLRVTLSNRYSLAFPDFH